ncbi:polysaccharide deacetylase family protein [Psychroserpens ponticola]|uniref:Polysaccharide deacetylase family protein n=1 Tax=Psychroserpens ponticola TaxID=2932268 RepID=A0ABY7RYS9_9FLAO|nr:polysaccharide deacetylase family protein [Psychroserpens ponticola]WCO02023.1 polysaccharide deacetylase family protein [Psychroserpens ponticola]
MKITPVKTPLVAKKMFPNYVWDIPTNTKELYLTFDDGPTPKVTNWTLDILKQYNAKATFFCIGANIEKHPEIFQNIIKAGHTIGNHTQHHVKGWKTKTKTYISEVLQAEKQIELQRSERSHLFRPPYGQIKPKQGKKLIALNYKVIMWDVLSFDWQKETSREECLNNVISKSKKGSIIVFHDSIKASKNMMYALPKVLEYFSEAGFNFKSLNF